MAGTTGALTARISLNGDDVKRTLDELLNAGNRLFADLQRAAEQTEIKIPTDQIKSDLLEIGKLADAVFDRVGQAAAKAGQQAAFGASSPPVAQAGGALPVAAPNSQLATLAATANSVFTSISNGISQSVSGFARLSSVIKGSVLALTGVSIGGVAVSKDIIKVAKAIKEAVDEFSDLPLGEKVEKVVGSADALEEAIKGVGEASRASFEGFQAFGDFKAEGLHDADFSELETAARGVGAATRDAVREFQAEGGALSDVAAEAVAASAAFREMQTELGAVGPKAMTPLRDMRLGLETLGVDSKVVLQAYSQLARGFESIQEKIRLPVANAPEQAAKDALAITHALDQQGKAAHDTQTAMQNLAHAQDNVAAAKDIGAIAVRDALGRQAVAAEGARAAALNLAQAEERLSLLRDGGKKRDPERAKELALSQAELAVEQAQLNLQRQIEEEQRAAQAVRVARRKAEEDAIKAEMEAERAELQLQHQAVEKQRAAQAVRDARRKAAEDEANSIPNLTKFVEGLGSGIAVTGTKVNATAENIAKGFVASLGQGGQALKSFSGSIDDIDRNAPNLVPILNKLADLFKATGDSALNSRIAQELFAHSALGGTIDESLVKALSRGSAGLKQARDLGHAITDLNKDFSVPNLENFATELVKIKDPIERTKLAAKLLGDTLGKQLVDSLSRSGNQVREAVAPFSDVVDKIRGNIRAAADFKAALDKLDEVVTEKTGQKKLDFGLLVAPAATPIINAIAEGLKNLNINFTELASNIGDSVKPVVDDFFKLIAGVSDTEINTEWLKTLRDGILSFGESASTVFNNVIKPAFTSLLGIASQAANAINGIFGTSLTGGNVIFIGALTAILGLFNSISIAALALAPVLVGMFSGAGSDVDAFTGKVKASGTALKDFATGSSIKTPQWLTTVGNFLQNNIPQLITNVIGAIELLWGALDKTAGILSTIFGRDISALDVAVIGFLGHVTGVLQAVSNGLLAIAEVTAIVVGTLAGAASVANSFGLIGAGAGAAAVGGGGLGGAAAGAALGLGGPIAFAAGLGALLLGLRSLLTPTDELKRKQSDLRNLFMEGAIGADEYQKQLAALEAGAAKAADDSGGLGKFKKLLEELKAAFAQTPNQRVKQDFKDLGLEPPEATNATDTPARRQGGTVGKITVVDPSFFKPVADGKRTIDDTRASAAKLKEELQKTADARRADIANESVGKDPTKKLSDATREALKSGQGQITFPDVFDETAGSIDKMTSGLDKSDDLLTALTKKAAELRDNLQNAAPEKSGGLLDQLGRFAGNLSLSTPAGAAEFKPPAQPDAFDAVAAVITEVAKRALTAPTPAARIGDVFGQVSQFPLQPFGQEPQQQQIAPTLNSDGLLASARAAIDQLLALFTEAGTRIGQTLSEAFTTAFQSIGPAIEALMAQILATAQTAASALDAVIARAQAAAQAAAGAASAGGGGDSGSGSPFASGGLVFGPGTGTSDSIPALLSHGEGVLTAKALGHYGNWIVGAINGLRLPRHFTLPRLSVGGLIDDWVGRLEPPHFASGGLARAAFAAVPGGGGALHPVTIPINLNGRTVSTLRAFMEPDVVEQYRKEAKRAERVSLGRKGSFYGSR